MTQENPENSTPTGETPRRPRGRQPGYSPKNKRIDAPPLDSGGGDKELVWDAENPNQSIVGGKKGRLNLPPNLLQIGLIALIVSIVVVFFLTSVVTPMVGKSQYKADITRLETDLVSIRGSNYIAGTSLSGIKTDLESLKARSNAFLVQGDLDSLYTKGEIDSKINTVKNSIPSSDTLISSVTNQVTSKLAQVDTKMAQVDAKLATLGNGTYVSTTDFNAAVAMLLAKINLLGTSVNYSFIGSGDSYAMLVGPNSKGAYTGKIDFTYAAGNETRLSSLAEGFSQAVARFYATTAGQYSPTIVQGTDGWYLSMATIQVVAFELTSDGAIQYIPLRGLYAFGTPNKAVIYSQ